MQLIIPMAGGSTRFPGVRPKWMLTHPSGNFMAIEAIKKLDLDAFESLLFVHLAEHEERYHFKKAFLEELEDLGVGAKSTLIELKAATKDQPETIQAALELAAVSGPFFAKDSDNVFAAAVSAGNFVCYGDLNTAGLIKPSNKSYIELASDGTLVNIVEKQVVSPYFCVGGYGFRSAEDYLDSLRGLSIQGNRYISSVIFDMMLRGHLFEARGAKEYTDWGTLEDWDRFKRGFATLFVDLDGTLFYSSSAHFPPYIGETGPIEGNMQVLRELQDTGRFEIIVTTSRPEKYREATVKQLEQFGLFPKSLLMGLQHSKRLVINDYTRTNPYKSCDAINLRRDADELRDILGESLGFDFSGS